MTSNSRKRNYQGRENESWVEIESSEDSDSRMSGNPEDNIEEDEESHESGTDKANRRSSGSYPPLDVRRLRASSRLSVNQERTLNMGRKTVLYGQTPKAICRRQLQAMADLNGMNIKEFAKQVLAGSDSDRVNRLRDFHTRNQPELAPLFDDVEKCILPIDKKSTCDRNDSSSSSSSKEPHSTASNPRISRREIVMRSDPDTQTEHREDSASEIIYDSDENESFSHLATCYAQIPTMLAHDLGESSNNRLRSKKKNKSESHSSEVSSRTPSKTIVPETESDSSEEPYSPRDLGAEGTISLSPNRFNHNVQKIVDNARNLRDDNTDSDSQGRAFANSNLSHRSSLPSSTSGNGYDRIARRRTIESMEYSDENLHVSREKTNAIKSMDYNNFLDELLFDEAPKVPKKVSLQSSNVRKEGTSHRVDSQKQPSSLLSEKPHASGEQKIGNQNAEPRVIKDNDQTSIVRQSSNSYNKVLGDLLFGEPCSNLRSCSRSSEQELETSDGQYHRPSVQYGECALPSRDHASKISVSEVFDTPPEDEISDNCQVDVSSSPKKKKPETANKEDKILPSSLELSESLWNSLDGSLEF